ncbi:MAG: ABC transporter ATP-binding protein [Firmicutes bacterium]|nr:ABC transporter ATP-binding protein [Bacillota bacterium]
MIKRIFQSMTSKGRFLLILSIVLFTLYALSGTAMMLLLLDMIKKIIAGQEMTLSHYWFGLIGLVVFKAICNAAADLAKHFAGFDIGEATRKNILLRLKCFSLGFYTKERVGEISTIIQKDVTNMMTVVAHMWSRMISDFIVALILGTGLFIVDWRMGLAMISLLPIALLLLLYGIKSGKALQKESQDDLADMVSLFVEYVKGIPLLKAFSESSSFQTQLKQSTERFGESSKKISKSYAGILGRYSLLMELCFAVLATVGAYLLLGTELSVFDYLIFIIISREFYKPFVGMEGHYLNYIKVTDSYRRIQTLFDAPIVEVPPNPKKPKSFAIAFKDVGFFYEKGEFELKNASFRLKEGTLTALVGPSGSGKTTVTNLLLRFWEPQRGLIRIGGVDIREMDYDELLGNISIVMQTVMLFADTIEGNIKVGNRNATRQDVIAAAQKAMIHDYIISLPQGYDTPVGENGVGLSGGQKQRISIARAFLKNAPIVILDEITSNVDPVNEVKIQQAISNLAQNRTVLVIAHHLRTIRTADSILVFNEGEIVQTGTHDELIRQDGLYNTLWRSQEEAKEWKLTGAEKELRNPRLCKG